MTRSEALAEAADLVEDAVVKAAQLRAEGRGGTALLIEHLASLVGLLALGRVGEPSGLAGGMKARDRALEGVAALRREAGQISPVSSVDGARALLETLHQANAETGGAVKHELWEILRHPAVQTGALTPAPRGLGLGSPHGSHGEERARTFRAVLEEERT